MQGENTECHESCLPCKNAANSSNVFIHLKTSILLYLLLLILRDKPDQTV